MTLTREEILAKWDTMKPHERDSWIFYDVLGWMPLDTAPNAYGGFGTIPRMTDDMSEAWKVVEHMKSKHWYFMLSDENEEWEASFYWDPHLPAYEALSAEAPQAICKAALLAVLKV